jgi:DNA polymerase-3 subunit gamma/tau
MLTKEAFNALLKTIEEPPPNVIFILATTEEHKVPPTIVSRCQRLMFRLVGQEDLVKHLRSVAEKEQIEIDEQALELIARRSGGGLRDALGLIDQASLLGSPGQPVSVAGLLGLLGAVHEDVLLEISAEVLSRQGHQVLSLTNRLLIEGREPSVIALELARHFLSLTKASYLVETGNSDPGSASSFIVGSAGYLSGLLEQAGRFERAELSQIVEQLDRLEQTCRRSSQPALNLEMGLLSICHRHDMLIVQDLAQRLQALEAAVAGGAQLLAPSSNSHSAQPMQRPAQPVPAPKPVTQTVAQPVAAEASSPAAPVPAAVPGPVVQQSPAAVTVESAPDRNLTPATGQGIAEDRSEEPAATADRHQSAPAAPVEQAAAQAQVTPPQVIQAQVAQPQTAQRQAADAAQAEQIQFASAQEEAADLDQFWSQLLEQLQKVNIPAYSVLSEHAFPVGLTAKDCTIGVLTEHFQNTVERRIEKIKIACEAVLGRSVMMKVRIVTAPIQRATRPRDEAPPVKAKPSLEQQSLSPSLSQAAGREHQSASASDGLPGLEPSSLDEEPEPVRTQQQNSGLPLQTAAKQSPAPAGGLAAPPAPGPTAFAAGDPDKSGENGESGPRVVSGKAASSALSDTGDGFDARTVRDAYKIFEGPGSRLIV